MDIVGGDRLLDLNKNIQAVECVLVIRRVRSRSEVVW